MAAAGTAEWAEAQRQSAFESLSGMDPKKLAQPVSHYNAP